MGEGQVMKEIEIEQRGTVNSTAASSISRDWAVLAWTDCAVVSALPTWASVVAENYNTDCVSIFNGKCQTIQSSFWWVHAEGFASLAAPQKDKWAVLAAGWRSFVICNNKMLRIWALLQLIASSESSCKMLCPHPPGFIFHFNCGSY